MKTSKEKEREKLYAAIRKLWPEAHVSVSWEQAGYWKVLVDGLGKRGKYVLCVQTEDAMNCLHLLVDNCPQEFLNA